ncbi:hypothetical protein EW026_g7672 [Hermanssonia centrifuga]|uniref:Methyltransferase domain-containing protein n=1 Tax=Hermanssonia centrifuga TaxID=98765 RepID=A0A4S4K700_9APHY|nr:hypothetical protein EW026_g7672 [Hermanssonia centrifuga]
MSVFTRHPRYVFLLLTILLICSFLLLPAPPSSIPLRPVKSVKRILQEEDASYAAALEGREAMVRKWGPTAEDVVSFPVKGDFYTLWDFFIPAFRCPHRVERVGTLGDGGKWFCGLDRLVRQRTPCTIYSFGVNGESSFEAALLSAAPHCQVYGYDFSVNRFGPEVHDDLALSARSHFFPYALGSEDSPYADPPTFTLQSLMRQNGHSFIDVLKIDIEGAEFDALSAFIDSFVLSSSHASSDEPRHPHMPPSRDSEVVLPIGQLQLEIHAWGANGASFAKFKKWWESMESAGLRPFWTEPNLVYVNLVRGARPDLAEYSFMNIRGKHALTDDRY